MSHIAEPTAADTTARTFYQGTPPLTGLYLYIAGGCNLACQHCWITPQFLGDSSHTGPVLKLEYAEKAIREAKPLGLNTVKLTGGEPTIHPQFRELVALIRREGLRVVMESNGMLIDDDLAAFLREQRTDFISISLDGATPDTHDTMRGVKGSFERTVNGIRALVKVGYQPQVICSIHKGNIDEVPALLEMSEALGCGSLKLNIIQRVGRGDRFADQNGLSIERILEFNRYVEEELRHTTKLLIYLDVPPAFHSIRRLLDDSGRCAVLNILGILSSGDVSMCGIGVNVPDLVYGHIATDNLADIWKNHPGLQDLREKIPYRFEGICSTCIHNTRCFGKCVANNYHMTGKLNDSHHFCQIADERGLFPQTRKS